MTRSGIAARALVRSLVAFVAVTATAAFAEESSQALRTATEPVQIPQLEPKAIELLKAMGARLAGAKTMTFTAVVSYEAPSVFGPALVYSTKSSVTMQRPDKLRVVTSADGPATEFYYDGKTMTAYAPVENLVATGPAPSTIDATLEKIFTDAAIYYPFADVVVADPYKDFADGMQVAFYIGRSHVVGGTTTDMVAFANGSVFAQIWIGADDRLPRKLRAVYLNDPSMLRHDMDLSDWKLDAKVATGAFATPKAATAMRIAFARPDQMPAGMPPPPKAVPDNVSKPTTP